MEITKLNWDSDFFGFPVGRITLKNSFEHINLKEIVEKSVAKVIYIFASADLTSDEESALIEIGAKKFDTKTIFEKEIIQCGNICNEISEAKELTPEIEQLAYTAGWCSRYNLDPKFHPYFKRLYNVWINKTFSNPDSVVLTYYKNYAVAGMVTLDLKETFGEIGLLAVAENYRGFGVGMKLLEAVDVYCFRQSKKKRRVATQQENEVACNLYLKAGYKIAKQESVWHLWK